MTALPAKPWVQVQDAADQLGVSSRTIERYCEAGQLECLTLPSGRKRVSVESLEKILRQTRQTRQPSE